jgi:alpha-L-rhamnosidase
VDSVFSHVVHKTLTDYNGHVSTGLVGAEWLMRTLSDHGRGDIAYKMATNTTYPSWGYMAENGATTIWELWNGNTADPSMNSGNHVMLLGDLVVWYYEYLGGIRPAAAAYKKIMMKPLVLSDLKKVDAAYHSPYGWIRSNIANDEKGFSWQITIPVNTSAEVYIPAASEKQVSTADNAKFLRMEDGFAVYAVGSGIYDFNAHK